MVRTIIVSALFCLSFRVYATEGMWIPSMIHSLVADDMKAMGMKISAEDLYSINRSCIKDAVVHFDGGCTSVLVSEQGLLLTNHHCGYGRIQSHSSLEHNYLEDGFWAMSKKEELKNDGMEATIIKEIRDVTAAMREGLPVNATEKQLAEHYKAKGAEIVKQATENTHYKAYIKPFYYGNQFLLFITEVFTDIRLVGAPPSSIGKYGYDTDNWVWPRHTGDFSVFRIYAGPDNKPAAYSEQNVPYKPAYYLPVNISGVEENDFTIVYGFPGQTENYITESSVEQLLTVINPIRLKMREASLSVIDQAMRQDPLTKIQYAAKQSRISNAYKKWIGQSKGLVRHHVLDKKDSLERVFKTRMEQNPEWKHNYAGLLDKIETVNNEKLPFSVGREYFVEFYYVGPEAMRFSYGFAELVALCKDETKTDEDIRNWINEKKKGLGFFKNYDAQVDKAIMKKQLPFVREDVLKYLQEDILPDAEKYGNNPDKFCDDAYARTIFTDEKTLTSFLENFNRKWYKKIEADPIFMLARNMENMYQVKVRETLGKKVVESDSLMTVWMAAQMKVIPERTYYPDANGTLRLTFGKVEGYEPFDGAEYTYYTTVKGVMEKEDPTNPEYVVPARLKTLYQGKDYGRYADKSGEMRVAFIASNHTSGGNSGSPVIDANGHLIGLNFDRTWESTMSDVMFNPEICRNVAVDIRYVLFVIDKYAGAGHLVEEMKLVE